METCTIIFLMLYLLFAYITTPIMRENYYKEIDMDKNKMIFAAAFAGTVSVISGSHYIKTMREENKKRKAIKAWERDRKAVIQHSHDRVMSMLNDPEIPLSRALEVWVEEQEFLKIITHPSTMY